MPRTQRPVPEFKLRKLNGKPNYYVCWSESRRSHRVSSGTDDPKRAQQFLAEFIHRWTQDPVPEKPTVNQAIEAYLDFKKDDYKRKKQPERYWKNLEHSLKPMREAFGPLRIDTILRQQTRDYANKKLDEGYSPATVRREFEILIAALNFVYREGWIDRVPYIEKPAPPPPKDVWMTPRQVRTFLDACKTPHIRLFALMALHTLSRKTAILELKWSQVDLDNRLIDFNPPGRQQTNKKRVAVKISDSLHVALQEAKEFSLTDYVIEFNGKPVQDVKRAFQRAARKAGLPWVTPHILRHTGATLLAQSGVSMWEIAGIMGDRLATVERHYAKHHPSYLQEAVSTLDRLYQE